MATARTRATGVAALAVLLAALTGCSAQTMTIFPEPKKQNIAIGKGLVLTCQVDAPDPALVTTPVWRDKNENIIPPNKDGFNAPIFTMSFPEKQVQILYILTASTEMTGEYTCTAYYTNIPIVDKVYLQIFAALTWNNANDNQYAVKGSNYKIMCEVQSEPSPNVEWLRDNKKILTGGRYVIHTNGLLINNIQESDDGTYMCRASVTITGEIGVKYIKLEVYTPPVMVEQEKNVMIKAGGTASISCRAHGIPEPSYTWIKASSRADLASTPRFSVNRQTGKLIFERIEPNDYGTYICNAENGAGQNETIIEVEVLVPPKIFEFKNKTSPLEDPVLECKATGRPAPQMIFRKLSNKDPYVEGLNDNGRVLMEVMSSETGDQMQSTGVLSITKDLRRSDDGLYECIARSPVPKGGEAIKNGHLTVQFPPNFDNMQDSPIWTWNALPVNISCLAEGIPNATIKWRRHDSDLVGSSHVKIYGSGPYSYITIIPSDRSLYGNYMCIATNSLGEAVHTIQLREAFVPGPVAQIHPKSLSATTVEFEILGPGENMGPPILAYTTQYREDGNLDWTFAKNKTWSVNSPYFVEELKPMTAYQFRIAAVNQVGVGAWVNIPTVVTQKRAAPDTPVWRNNSSPDDLMQSEYMDRYALYWAIPVDNGEPIDMYEIEICNVQLVSGEWRVTNNECEKRELRYHDIAHYEVTGLAPDRRYRLSVRAHNVLGLSQPASLLVQTAPGIPNDDSTDDDTGKGARALQLSSGAIIGLALGGVLLCLIIVDLILFCWKRIGVVASLCTRRAPTHQDDDSKLGSPKPRAPPSPAPLPPPVKLFPSPTDEKEPLKEVGAIIMKKNSSVEFDGQRAFATSGGSIIGKNSAV